MNSDLGEHLSVEGDARFFQAVHEGGVVHAVCFAASRDSGDPQSSEITFFRFAADVSLLTGFVDGFLSGFEQFALSAPVAFSEL